MAKKVKMPGRIESASPDGIVTGAAEIFDDGKEKMQSVINTEVSAELLRLENEKQNNLNFDNEPTENSNNPVTSGGVYTAEKALSDAIEAILILIPSAATALNQLADKSFVESALSTATATFRGTYNVVSDLGLAYNATHEQIAAKLGQVISTADNNDYCFVQVPESATSTDINHTERYKFNGSVWAYEYDLNNSGFTADQWAAINSNITAVLVAKLTELPTAEVLATLLAGKQDNLTFDNRPTAGSDNPVKSGGVYASENEIIALINALEVEKQDKMTFDSTPTNGSSNPVTSGGVYEAIYLVQVALASLDNRVISAEHSISVLTENVGILRSLYQALTSNDIIVGSLPTTGVANTVYRVPGVSTYADWMYYNGTWVKLAEYTTLDGYLYKGIATPSGSPAASAVKMFYFALTAGTYTNFGGLVCTEGINILKYDGANWTKEQITYTDGGVYDITANTGQSYADLSSALGTNGANVPVAVRKGGMSVKFVHTSDNKYVQYFLPKDTWSDDANEWEKINLEEELEQLNEKIGDYSKESTYNSSSYSGVRYKATSSSVVAADSSINGYIVPLTIGNKYTFYGQWYSLRTYTSMPVAGMTGGTQIDVSNVPNKTVVHTAVEGENYALVTVGTTYQDLKVTEEVSGLTERVEALEGHLNDDIPESKVLNVADITSDFVLGYWNVNNGVGNSAVWTTSTSLHTVTKPIRKGQIYKSNTQLATSSAVSHALLDNSNKIIKLLTTANVNSGYTITDTDITSGATKIEICYRDTAQTVAIYCEYKEYLKDQLEGIEKSVDDTNTRIDNVVANETIEFQKRAKYFVHYKTAGEIDVFVKGYDGTHDLEVRFMNGNINYLWDFFDWRIFENDTAIVKHDETGNKALLNGGTGTDYISGYAVKAVNNADGDLTTLVPTGGWHGYNGVTTNVTKTARKLWANVFADGRELGVGESAFCNTIVLKWANRVQAANTEKEDGTGREVLEEIVTVVFDGNKSIVTKEITALEDIKIQHHYGLNVYNGGLSKVVFVTDTTIGSRGNDLISEDDKCRELRFVGTSHEFFLHIDDFGEGTYKHSNRSYSGQYVGATNKGYFGCPYIEGAESEWLLVPQNGCIFFRGYFDCHPLT